VPGTAHFPPHRSDLPKLSTPCRKNISLYRNPKSVPSLPRPAPNEGRFAIVTERGARDAMAAAISGAAHAWSERVMPGRPTKGRRGRRSRVVLAPRPWRQVSGTFPADDGGNKRRFTGESTKEAVNPSRGESSLAKTLDRSMSWAFSVHICVAIR